MLNYSVIIPAHDEEAWIGAAVESAVNQSWPPFEIIVVDDGSTDRTPRVLRQFPSVRVVRHHPARGLAQARNSGIRVARGEWVAFLDADDRWDIDKIEQQARCAQRTGAGLVYCGARLRLADGQCIEVAADHFRRPRQLRRELMIRNCITGSGSAVLVRRELLLRAGGFDGVLSVAEDWDLWMRLAPITRFACVRQPLVTLNKRGGSLGGDPNRMFQVEDWVVRKNAELFRQFGSSMMLRRKAQARRYERRAKGYMGRGDLALARRDFADALRLWPFRLECLIPFAKLCVGAVNHHAVVGGRPR